MRNFTKQYINGNGLIVQAAKLLMLLTPTEEVMGKIAKGNEEDVNKAVDAADKVYLEFRHSSVEERRELLDKIVKEYQNRKMI